MNKRCIVRLTAKERRVLREVVRQRGGSSQQVRRQMLLEADVEGLAWTDERIADAFLPRAPAGELAQRRRERTEFAHAAVRLRQTFPQPHASPQTVRENARVPCFALRTCERLGKTRTCRIAKRDGATSRVQPSASATVRARGPAACSGNSPALARP